MRSKRTAANAVWMMCTLLACLALAGSASPAGAAVSHKRTVHRVGGRVHQAWPHRAAGKAPRGPLARWLARQVGPTRVRPCRIRRHGRTIRCHRKKLHHKSALPPGFRGQVIPNGPRGGGARGHIAAAGDEGNAMLMRSDAATSTGSSTLLLIRSFDIPTSDPSYVRLLNWSWTYDSAISAAAFAVAGDTSQAQELLDQLSALEHPNGSIEAAFNVSTNEAESVFRSGTIAAAGLAGSVYDQYAKSSRYLAMQERTATYLISLQGSNGLVRGGPDVSWYSTQHNLLAYAFLARLGNEATSAGQRTNAGTYYSAAARIASAISSQLLVRQGSSAYFIEGAGDDVRALDTEALGIMFLQSLGQTATADQVLSYTQAALSVSGRSISLSSAPGTYNMTYSAKGPFSGFVPFAGANAPDVLWPEGSAQVLLAEAMLGQSTSSLTQSINSLAAVTGGSGGAPLQADRTVTSTAYGAEFHVWPAAAAGAWVLLAEHKPAPQLFPAFS